jgi:diguanylate cyclase (GGDEF)-like protein/PAS domain S-box-containing protein
MQPPRQKESNLSVPPIGAVPAGSGPSPAGHPCTRLLMGAPMTKFSIPLTPRAIFILAGLIFLGFAGNYWSLPLFFGVDFILGSIAVLIVVQLYGPGFGVLAALIASSYTYFLWGHPYAVLIFSLEALFVGFFLRQGRRSLLLLDGLYWLVIGLPAVWCSYGLMMHMDGTSTLLIMLKQGINGIFNALLASLGITFLPFRKILTPDSGSQTTSLRETLFNLLVALILAPALFIMFLNSRGTMQAMQAETIKQIERGSDDIVGQLTIWYQSNLKAVTALGALAARVPLKPSPALQHDTEIIQKGMAAFQAMYVADTGGTTVAFSPPVNNHGQSTIGLNFADRAYFKELKITQRPVLSGVLVGRGAAFSPVVTLSVPILKGDQFSGYASGTLTLQRILEMLEPYGRLRHLSITLIDSQGQVVTSTVPDRQPLMTWNRSEATTLKLIQNSVYQWFPGDEKLPEMTRWKNSYYVQETTIAHLPWKLIVEAPVAPLQRRLYSTYVANLVIMAGLAVLALLIALIFSRWLVRPLMGLAQVTSNLPEKLLHHQDLTWPKSSATEVHSLVGNLQVMAQTLENNVHELQTGSAQLAELNQGLEGEIAVRVLMEEALRRSETLLRNVFESIPDLLTVLDRDFNIIMSNWHGLGESVPEAERHQPHKCHQVYLHRDHPCEPCHALQVFASGQPVRLEKFIPVDHSTREITAYPVRDQFGQIIMVAEYVRDITQRHQMEETLRESETKYRFLAENARDLIWRMDLNQHLTFASPAVQLLTGFTPEEFITLGLDQILTPASLQVAQENLARLQEIELREKPPLPPAVTLEIEHRRKDGSTIWTEVHASLLRGNQGEPAGLMGASRDITERRQVQEALETANDRLKKLVQDGEERNRHMARLNEMSDVLQSCQTCEEAIAVINQYLPQFFPTSPGALYLSWNFQNLLTLVTAWGRPPPSEEQFSPEDCWAIRSGRTYQVVDPAVSLLCKHISSTDHSIPGYLCVPLMAQGTSLGILHLRLPRGAAPEWEASALDANQRLAKTIGENLALSLANLKLRETLQNQAIHDPLTGLYNRRYLEESLHRELHRSRRLQAPLGVVMMDLDHLKDFNDSLGHGAGDALLSALAQVINANIRSEDIACRYGGEEILLVMPGSSLETTRDRAEIVRQAVKALQVKYQDRLLTSPTLSLGVAIFPDHGGTAEEVIAAADAALYRAKQAGQDRVEIASLDSPAAAVL